MLGVRGGGKETRDFRRYLDCGYSFETDSNVHHPCTVVRRAPVKPRAHMGYQDPHLLLT